ncbi:D-glycero-beta-D-manno-heptose 1-phosphate adenylyltransferase [bacterium]|nr:D-glycero-beta-D-manno-heptose 1-phosphate adenylyltransferase [bacterium]MBU1652584.1 D-glycero-beta-D-manno-heptose 1-phosphate adenylyltransferase [bacterium]
MSSSPNCDIIIDWPTLFEQRVEWRKAGKTVVFTNGVFDLLHRGHFEYLAGARKHGDLLVIGVNSDASVRRLKGAKRPLVNQENRVYGLSCLRFVDVVTLFDQDTPIDLIKGLNPDVLVKGADYEEHEIVGAPEVKATGGKVVRIPLSTGHSSSNLIDDIIKRHGK